MLLHEELTEIIIKSFYTVYNKLGYGFLGKVYENALLLELKNQGWIAPNRFQLKFIMMILA